jgi:choline monooxygenase
MTIPAAWYRDRSVYDAERTTIWSKEWLLFCPAAELDRPGRYVAAEVVGYPIFVAVAPDGALRGYHNVCPHRAGVLVWPGAGTASNLVCRYHGWAFGWDGALKAARDFGDDPALCVDAQSLRPIHVERWRNLVFVHIGPEPRPFGDAMAPFAAACDPFEFESFVPVRRVVRQIACNWKAYADNYLEGYHVALLHPSLARTLDMSTYRVTVPDESYCLHTANATDGSPSVGAWLFRYPNLAVNLYVDGMNVERIMPVGHDRTEIVYDYFAVDGLTDSIDAMVEMSNVVLDEDQAICEAVQRNLDAGIYESGCLSPRHESAVAWFQSRVASTISGMGVDDGFVTRLESSRLEADRPSYR